MTLQAALHFPYMGWAKEQGWRSPYCLSQSGMPAAEGSFLAAVESGPADLEHPGRSALPRLTARLAELFGVAEERVLVVPGASGAMGLAALRWMRAGARVLAETPSYEPLRALPRLFGAELALLERRLDEGWRLSPARAAELARGARPAHVLVTNPHNPSSALDGPEVLTELARIVARTGGVLVSNEIYMELVPPARRVHAFALAPNAVSLGSLTKAYGLGALRVGWLVLGEGLVHERAALGDLANLAWVDLPTAALRRALAALERLPELLAPLRRFEHESRPHLVRWLADTPGVRGLPPDAGLTTFARIEGVSDTLALARFLAAHHGVDAVPGEFFGAPGHLRIGYGVPEATLVEGLARLSAGIDAFKRA